MQFENLIKNDNVVVFNQCDFDFDFIYKSLITTYWVKNKNLSIECVTKAFKNSWSAMVFKCNIPVAFGRMITDYVSFGYLSDVFVSEEYRGRGIGKFLVNNLLNHECVRDIEKIMLATKDAHGLYQQFGFDKVKNVERWMVKIKF